jgi:FixJ family two-component response regulator
MIHVIDDDAALCTALGRLLRACGHTVELYDSATAYLERAAPATEPGCIVLDVDLPGLSGPQLQARLASDGAALPIVFLTANGSISMGVRAMRDGAEDFLTKPVTKDALLEAVGRALERSAREQARLTALAALRVRFGRLTARENEVLALLIRGQINKQIAHAHGTTERTIKAHRASIMEKTQAGSLADLVMMGSQLGLLKDGAAEDR